MPKKPPSASAGSGIVSGKQIYTVLIHADALLPRMLRQRAMQAFGNPQLELTGVVLEIVRLPDRPSSRAACSHARLASAALATAASSVSPQVMQPGRSGKDTTKPPSSGSFTSSMRYGRARYSFNVFMILLAFYDLSDHFYIDSFDWFMLWHCDRPTTRFSESIVAAAAARCTHHIAIGFQYSPKFIKPKFPAQRTDFTEQLFPF